MGGLRTWGLGTTVVSLEKRGRSIGFGAVVVGMVDLKDAQRQSRGQEVVMGPIRQMVFQ